MIYDIHDLAFDLMERNSMETIITKPENTYIRFFDDDEEENDQE